MYLQKEVLVIAFGLLITSSCSPKISQRSCDTNFDCFIEAAKTCQPAFVTLSLPLPVTEFVRTITWQMKIEEAVGKECSFLAEITDYIIKYNNENRQKLLESGKTEEQLAKEEQERTQKAYETEYNIGSLINCLKEPQELARMLGDWKNKKLIPLTTGDSLKDKFANPLEMGCTATQMPIPQAMLRMYKKLFKK